MEDENLPLESLSPSLSIADLSLLAFMVWDKYRLRVVAPVFLPTQKITFIYCYD